MLSRESARGCDVVVISQLYLFGQSADSCPDFWQTYNVLTVPRLMVLVMSVLNVSEETDPTFEWALNLGGHLIWAWQTLRRNCRN